MDSLPISILSSIVSIVYLLMLGFSIYAFVLFVKLARRGIKALDIYINEKSGQ